MFVATLICSDRVCADEVDVIVDDLAELDFAACECGTLQVVLALAEWEPAPVAVLV
jgi:hypothetical protein